MSEGSDCAELPELLFLRTDGSRHPFKDSRPTLLVVFGGICRGEPLVGEHDFGLICPHRVEVDRNHCFAYSEIRVSSRPFAISYCIVTA